MSKHKFSISISGTKTEATKKVNGLATLAAYLSVETIVALAHVAKTDPDKVELAKKFLGV
ncbi:MAG: hypothetical protein JKY54_07205 [Flavobacteriales bacterium]|nr:hypothetical protein [Flavobacteriales bacterium]